MPLTFISVVAFVVSCFAGFFGMQLFDSIVKFEYEKYRSEWEKDGCPTGYAWMPDDQNLRLSLAGSPFFLRILRSMPEWARGTEIECAVHRLRRIFVIFLGTLLTALGSFFVTFFR